MSTPTDFFVGVPLGSLTFPTNTTPLSQWVMGLDYPIDP
jgi:hypothetical protein